MTALTVGDLIRCLALMPNHCEVHFGYGANQTPAEAVRYERLVSVSADNRPIRTDERVVIL